MCPQVALLVCAQGVGGCLTAPIPASCLRATLNVLRYWLIELPARIVDTVGLLYLVVLTALVIACFVSVGLTVLAYLSGFPLL